MNSIANKAPKVSVITVCYNVADSIEETICSVVNQTYPSIEYIVIDGGSTDGTCDIIKKYVEKIDTFVSEPDHGIYDAMNKGLEHATGEWVGFINAGDRYFNADVFANLFSQSFVCDMDILYGDTEFMRPSGTNVEKSLEPDWLNRNMPTCHQSFFVRTALAKPLGFDTRYKYAADFNMIYQIFQQSGEARTCHAPIVVSTYNARWGASMERPNEVYKESLDIRKPSLQRTYGYLRYYIKKMVGMK